MNQPSQMAFNLPDEEYPYPCIYSGYLDVWDLGFSGQLLASHIPVEICYDGTYNDLNNKMAALRNQLYPYDSHISVSYDRIEQAPRTPIPNAFLKAFD